VSSKTPRDFKRTRSQAEGVLVIKMGGDNHLCLC
jgi:hypothetical protein